MRNAERKRRGNKGEIRERDENKRVEVGRKGYMIRDRREEGKKR